MQDLATQDQLPEFVSVAEMQGSELLARRAGAAATSLLADKGEGGPSARPAMTVADIDAARMYRVAFAFHGMPSYGAEPPRMPKLFRWATQEEFLTGPGTRIPVRNLVQTSLQTVEAVAQYVRKHKRIAPRPVQDSLTEYIANPRDNDYAGSDWLHLGVDVAWKQGGGGSSERYTLNLGVRPAGQGEAGPPRKNAKQFAELSLAEGAVPMNLDFGTLDGKFPLAVSSQLTRNAVAMDKNGKTYSLANAGPKNAIGQAALVRFQLTNKGPADLAVTAVLSDTVMRSIYGQVWPDDARGKSWYAGYHRALGPYKQPPRHEDAALLLVEGKARTLVAPNAGYNFGLVGVAQDLTVKAGQSLTLPLLLASLDRPDSGPEINLAAALDAVKEQLLKRN
jgi:hypothetical protein